jgi:hypothetical protein
MAEGKTAHAVDDSPMAELSALVLHDLVGGVLEGRWVESPQLDERLKLRRQGHREGEERALFRRELDLGTGDTVVERADMGEIDVSALGVEVGIAYTEELAHEHEKLGVGRGLVEGLEVSHHLEGVVEVLLDKLGLDVIVKAEGDKVGGGLVAGVPIATSPTLKRGLIGRSSRWLLVGVDWSRGGGGVVLELKSDHGSDRQGAVALSVLPEALGAQYSAYVNEPHGVVVLALERGYLVVG